MWKEHGIGKYEEWGDRGTLILGKTKPKLFSGLTIIVIQNEREQRNAESL